MKFSLKIKNFLRKNVYNYKWRCVSCGKEIFNEEIFCEKCRKSLPFNDEMICNHCGRKVKTSVDYCTTCKNILLSLDKCRSVFNYQKPINFLIKRAKYDNKKYILDALSDFLFDCYSENNFSCDLITYIPMTEKSFKKRGYNQSQILAQNLSLKTNIPVFDGVIKVKQTTRQALLNKSQRLKNLIDAYKITDKKLVVGKSLVIVDDVSTTGSTGEALASKLKKAGANKVYLLTIASVPPKCGY